MASEVNWLFVVITGLFAFFMIYGYSRGFLRIAVSIVSMVFVIILVTYLSPLISNSLLENETTYNSIFDKVTEVFKDANSKSRNITKEEQTTTIESYPLPELMITDLIRHNTEEMYETLKVKIFEEYISGYLTTLIIKAGTFAILFILFRIIMRIIISATSIISRIPIIKGFNKTLGLLAGFLEALIIVWVFFFILIMFMGNPVADSLLSDINSSSLLSALFNANILYGIIG
ncbi:MAG: CvpA family protein [Lachnospiraceae bacterium]|nr:CvpA family protein [Lachnospiraceae bacterium]